MGGYGWAECPACKGTNLHVAERYDIEEDPQYHVVCDDCGYEDPDWFEEEYVALDHWNRRVVKGYIEGDDPTETGYDRLEDDDWDVPSKHTDMADISWTAPKADIRPGARQMRCNRR